MDRRWTELWVGSGFGVLILVVPDRKKFRNEFLIADVVNRCKQMQQNIFFDLKKVYFLHLWSSSKGSRFLP